MSGTFGSPVRAVCIDETTGQRRLDPKLCAKTWARLISSVGSYAIKHRWNRPQYGILFPSSSLRFLGRPDGNSGP